MEIPSEIDGKLVSWGIDGIAEIWTIHNLIFFNEFWKIDNFMFE